MSRQLNSIDGLNILTDSCVSVCAYLTVNQLRGWPIILYQPICLIYLLQCDIISLTSLQVTYKAVSALGAFSFFPLNPLAQ